MSVETGAVRATPDSHGAGLTEQPLDALRYNSQSDDPFEVAGMMRSMLPSNARILDFGCGTGSVTLIANKDRSNDIVAIEPDPERAEMARSRGLVVHQGFLDDAFIAQYGKFDLIMSADVLEHLPAPSEALASFANALKPGGSVLVSVPNVAHWTVRTQLLRGRFDYEPTGIMDATHLRWFTAESIVKLFEQSGFEVVEMRQTAGTFLPRYQRGLFRKIPRRRRSSAIRFLTRAFPLLFGVQHVLKARLKA